jgi:hypothetical protein
MHVVVATSLRPPPSAVGAAKAAAGSPPGGTERCKSYTPVVRIIFRVCAVSSSVPSIDG